MGHKKLKKFAENETFKCLLQPSAEDLLADGYFNLRDHEVKGRWNELMFEKDQPIVLELGCGKGEYTIDLAQRNPHINYIGVDIKGARLWKGAKYATENGLGNVAFLRTRIEFITAFFAPGEVSEIWLTFSDPQMRSENSRLTSPLFLERYRSFLRPGGLVHLKTDSRFLFEYSRAVAVQNGLKLLASTIDLYGTAPEDLFTAAAAAGMDIPQRRSSQKMPGQSEHEIQLSAAGMDIPQRSNSQKMPGQSEHEIQLSAAGMDIPQRRSSQKMPGQSEHENQLSAAGMDIPQRSISTEVACLRSEEYPSQQRATGSVSAEVMALYEVQTFYEKLFLEQGYKITYLSFIIDHEGDYKHPEFDDEYWRSREGHRQIFGHDTAETRRQKLKQNDPGGVV